MKKQSIYKQTEWDIKEAHNTIARKAQHKKHTKSLWQTRLYILFASVLGGTAIVTNYHASQLQQQINQLITIEQTLGQQNNAALKRVVYDIGEVIDGKTEDCQDLIMSINDIVFCKKTWL